jgi:hypothetical protein
VFGRRSDRRRGELFEGSVEQRLIEQIEAAAVRSERAAALVTAQVKKVGARLERVEQILDAGTAVSGEKLARELALIPQWRRRKLIDVRQPVVLISQIHRSGGTLLSQLFDCHPQCHVHPFELRLGPSKHRPKEWPRIVLDADPADWWEAVTERHVEAHFQHGYRKSLEEDPETFPFLLVPALARLLFEEGVRARAVESARDILDAYMTAYFNAWLDNHNLHGPDKRWVVAFSPWLATEPEDRRRFFDDYPDGRLIRIVRDPRGWYASASASKPGLYGELRTAIELWRASTLASLSAKRDYGDRVLLVRFDTLAKDTRAAMGTITSFLDIDLPEIALVPTFNGHPIRANSGFAVPGYGVLQGPADRGSTLDAAIGELIDELVGSVYEEALSVAV